MRKPRKRRTLRSRRMDMWRKINRYNILDFLKTNCSGLSTLYGLKGFVDLTGEQLHCRYQELEIALFGVKEAFYRKLVRS